MIVLAQIYGEYSRSFNIYPLILGIMVLGAGIGSTGMLANYFFPSFLPESVFEFSMGLFGISLIAFLAWLTIGAIITAITQEVKKEEK